MCSMTTSYLILGMFIIFKSTCAGAETTTNMATTNEESDPTSDTSPPEVTSNFSIDSSTTSTEQSIGSSAGETPISSGVTQETTRSSSGVTQETTGSSSEVTQEPTGSSSEVTQEPTGSSSDITLESTENSTAVTEDTSGSSIGVSQDPTTSSSEDITGSSSGVTQHTTGSSSELTSYGTGTTSEVTGSSSIITSDRSESSTSGSSSTTTSALSPTTPKYEYDTSVPDLSEAVFSLLIRLGVEADLTDTTAVATEILQQFNESFTDMREFKKIIVTNIGSDADTLSEETILELTLHFWAEELVSSNRTVFREDVDSRMEASSSSVSSIPFTVQPYIAQLDQLLRESDDVCAAEGDLCPDVLHVCSSNDQLCVHRCERYECGDHGVCVVTHNSDETRPSCQCEQDPDSVYERVGARCEEQTMRWQWVLGISAGVGGLLVLTLLVILCVCCRRKPRPPYSHHFPDDDLYMHEYKTGPQSAHSQPLDTGRCNQGYLQDDNAYRYEGNPAGMSFLHNQRGNHIEEKFKIQRPSLRS